MKELYYFIQNLLYFKKINFEDDKIFFIHINEETESILLS